MTLLEVDDVVIRFGGLRAIANVCLSIGEGRIHGLIGPNGAGKTSLINAISGLVPLTSGRIRLAGVEVQHLPAHRIAARGISRTFQHAEVFEDQTVIVNVATGSYLHRHSNLLQDLLHTPGKVRSERQAFAEAETMLSAFGLLHVKHVTAANLSFGMLKRVDLARALIARPRLLMLDEPTSGMDEAEAQELITTCRRIAEESNITLLVIEHNMRVIMRLAQTIHVLDHGEKIAEGAPQDIQRDPRVIEAYLGQSSVNA